MQIGDVQTVKRVDRVVKRHIKAERERRDSDLCLNCGHFDSCAALDAMGKTLMRHQLKVQVTECPTFSQLAPASASRRCPTM